jgi:hypothetical protein
MAATSIRLIAFVVSLLLVGSGVAFASSCASVVKGQNPSFANFCSTQSGLASGQSFHTSTKMHLAQGGHCYCCGWENWNGHRVCVHQCCN